MQSVDDTYNDNVLCVFLQDGDAPLHYASGGDHVAAIEVLLKSGAEINQTNNVGHNKECPKLIDKTICYKYSKGYLQWYIVI